MTYDEDQLWRSVWVWNAFWHTLYFIILIAICIIWRPTENNSRYAYSEMPQEDVPLSNLQEQETTSTAETSVGLEDSPQAKLA